MSYEKRRRFQKARMKEEKTRGKPNETRPRGVVGIALSNVKNFTIIGGHFKNMAGGIALDGSSNGLVEGQTFSNVDHPVVDRRGKGNTIKVKRSD